MILATIIGNSANLPYEFVKSLLACQGWAHLFQVGLYVPDNRNAVWNLMKNKDDDLLFIDSDMVFSPDDVYKIEKHLKDKDIVTGLYSMRGGGSAIFKKKEIYELAEVEAGLFEIDACGAGFLGISKRVIDKLDSPFSQFTNPLSGNLFGEDIAFCIKAKEQGFKIYCDSEIVLGHIKTETKYP